MRRDVVIVAAVLAAVVALVVFARLRTPSRVVVPPGREDVRISVGYGLDGSATVVVAPGHGSADDVRRGAPRVAERLLNSTAHVTTVRTSGGRPYAVVRMLGVYARGDSAMLTFQGGRAYEVLAEYGWTRPDVRVRLPFRASRWYWPAGEPRDPESAKLLWEPGTLPDGFVRLDANAMGAWWTAVLTVGGFAAAFAGISLWPRRRAPGRRRCGAVAIVASLVALVVGAWPAERLGFAGYASGLGLDLLYLVPLLWLVAVLLGPWLLFTPRRRATMRA